MERGNWWEKPRYEPPDGTYRLCAGVELLKFPREDIIHKKLRGRYRSVYYTRLHKKYNVWVIGSVVNGEFSYVELKGFTKKWAIKTIKKIASGKQSGF